jgi:uncharacterized membrane protein
VVKINLIRFITGVLLTLFLPGFAFSLCIFQKQKLFERIIFSVALSIALDVIIAFILGGNQTLMRLTGGYDYSVIFFILLNVTIICFCFYIIKKYFVIK